MTIQGDFLRERERLAENKKYMCRDGRLTMFRKMISCLLLMTFMIPSLAFAQAPVQDMTVLNKTAAVEKIFYGSEQTGSLLDRTTKLEKDVYGVESKDAIMTRIDKLYAYAKENSPAAPSFLMRLNAVEWALTHGVTTQPVKTRLENLEHVMTGAAVTGSFEDRLDKLMTLAYANGAIDINSQTITKDTLVKIKMITPLSTKTSRPDDIVEFQAVDDVYVGGQLVIAKGAQGFGKVTKVEPAKNFGRDAQLEISFDTIDAVDGSIVNVLLGDKAKAETKSLATAAGASVAGMVILGPIGVVGGAFVRGKDVTIPADAELYVQVKEDTNVYGLYTSAN